MAEVDLRDYVEFNAGRRKQYHGCHVEFKEEVYEDVAATQKEGRPIYKSRDIVMVHLPGGEKTGAIVTEQHKREYAEQWAAYKAGNEQPVDGTALSEWPAIPRTVVEELKHFQLRTVEALADCPDDIKRKLGPLGSWCKKAAGWLKEAKSGQSQAAALKEHIDTLERKNQKLQEQVALLLQRIDAIEGTNLAEKGRVAA